MAQAAHQSPPAPDFPPKKEETKGLNLNDLFLGNSADSGIWVEFYDGAELLIASTDNRAYKAALGRLARKNKVRMNDSNPELVGLIDDITCECLAKHVLLGWRNIVLNGEENPPYTPEIGKMVLLNAPKVREFVDSFAGDTDNFREQEVEDLGKP